MPAGVAKGFAFQDLWPLKPMSSEVVHLDDVEGVASDFLSGPW